MIWAENIYIGNSQSQILEGNTQVHVDSVKAFEKIRT
jgi:hypothetical protein